MEWKDVVGYEGLYKVSEEGGIWSASYGGIIRRTKLDRNGYEMLLLCKNGKYKTVYVHRVVAQAFLPNPFDLPQVNHKDENPLNNHVDNLEWCTRLYNMRYGTGSQRSRDNHDYEALANKRRKKIVMLSGDGSVVNEFLGLLVAERNTGVNRDNIRACCTGRTKTAGGYRWAYA